MPSDSGEDWQQTLAPSSTIRFFKEFNVAEQLQKYHPRYAERNYEAHKERGNAAFGRCDYAEACSHYTRAVELALGFMEGGGMSAFNAALETHPEDSAQQRFSGNDELIMDMLSYLNFPLPPETPHPSSGLDFEAPYPNLSAAICLANRSAAYLKLGNAAKALKDAQRAVKCAPEYLKGHKRVLLAYGAMGPAFASEASELRGEIKDFERIGGVMPLSRSALIACGWISWPEQTLVYESVFKRAAFRHMLATGTGEGMRLEVQCNFTLVNFQNCQVFMKNVHWIDMKLGARRSIEGLMFAPVDNANGDDLELPPHGRASPKGLKNTLILIARAVEDLLEEGIGIMRVMACQGLVDHVDIISETVNKQAAKTHAANSKPGSATSSLGKIYVMPAMTTGASQQHDGVPFVPGAAADDGCPMQ